MREPTNGSQRLPEVEHRRLSVAEVVYGYFYYRWKHFKPTTKEAIRVLWLYAWVIALGFAVLYLLGSLIQMNLLQLQTVVSFGAVELLAVILGKYLLENRERVMSVDDMVKVAENISRFSHLMIHYVDLGQEEEYPYKPYVLVNTKTKKAYRVPPYVDSLAEKEVVRKVEHDTKDKLNEYLKGLQYEQRYPEGDELSLG